MLSSKTKYGVNDQMFCKMSVNKTDRSPKQAISRNSGNVPSEVIKTYSTDKILGWTLNQFIGWIWYFNTARDVEFNILKWYQAILNDYDVRVAAIAISVNRR